MGRKNDYDLLSSAVLSLPVLKLILSHLSSKGPMTRDEVLRELVLASGDSDGDRAVSVFDDNVKALTQLGWIVSKSKMALSGPYDPATTRPRFLETIRKSQNPGIKYVSACFDQILTTVGPSNLEAVLHQTRANYEVASEGEKLEVKRRIVTNLITDLGIGVNLGKSDDQVIMPLIDPHLLEEARSYIFGEGTLGIYEFLKELDGRVLPSLISDKPSIHVVSSIHSLCNHGRVVLDWKDDAGPGVVEHPVSRRPVNQMTFNA